MMLEHHFIVALNNLPHSCSSWSVFVFDVYGLLVICIFVTQQDGFLFVMIDDVISRKVQPIKQIFQLLRWLNAGPLIDVITSFL